MSYVTVDIDSSKFLEDTDTESIVKELNFRGLKVVEDISFGHKKVLEQIRVALYRGEPLEELVRNLIHLEGYIA